jgi:hypothetical protein
MAMLFLQIDKPVQVKHFEGSPGGARLRNTPWPRAGYAPKQNRRKKSRSAARSAAQSSNAPEIVVSTRHSADGHARTSEGSFGASAENSQRYLRLTRILRKLSVDKHIQDESKKEARLAADAMIVTMS